MADIWEPPAAPKTNMQRVSEKKPLGTTLVTILVGFAALINGFFLALVGNFIPVFNIAMLYMFVGVSNFLLGVLEIYVGISIWNWKYSMRGLGVVSNIGIIVLNIFVFAIGIIGVALCIGSIIALVMLDTDR